ncbi:MAG: PilZ domain-containing protein [Xanthobacteraceae bacterium]
MQTEQPRQSPRHPLRRLAKVTSSKGGPSQLCMVTNVSDGGVRLQVLGAEIPDEFSLTLSGDGPADAGRYKVVWRLGTDVGARRLPAAPDAE